MTSLERFDFGGNKLTGTVPLEIAMLEDVVFIDIRENDLTGDMSHLCSVSIVLFDRDEISCCCGRFCRIIQIYFDILGFFYLFSFLQFLSYHSIIK